MIDWQLIIWNSCRSWAKKTFPNPCSLQLRSRKMEGAIRILKAYAFITGREEPDSYGMHRLVHRATLNWLAERCGRTVRRFIDIFPPSGHWENLQEIPPKCTICFEVWDSCFDRVLTSFLAIIKPSLRWAEEAEISGWEAFVSQKQISGDPLLPQ